MLQCCYHNGNEGDILQSYTDGDQSAHLAWLVIGVDVKLLMLVLTSIWGGNANQRS